MERYSFIYRDAKGDISFKEVSGISENEIYIQAFCLNSGALKTYRKDRILEFISGGEDIAERIRYYEHTLPPVVKSEARRAAWKRNLTGALEICFTGFDAVNKKVMQQLAEEQGFIVRQSVTSQVSILVCGYNAGPLKMQRARQQGAMVLSEHQFKVLASTGEIPVECVPDSY